MQVSGPDGVFHTSMVLSDRILQCVLQVFSPDGVFLTSFGEHGGFAGQLRMPCGICVTWQGHVIVCDGGNDRLQVFSEDGQFLRTIRPR